MASFTSNPTNITNNRNNPNLTNIIITSGNATSDPRAASPALTDCLNCIQIIQNVNANIINV